MSPSAEIAVLLRNADATLVRRRKHEIYRLRCGRIFVRSCTPSDCRSEKNSLSVLKRLVREVPA
jgi:hypothetical protein